MQTLSFQFPQRQAWTYGALMALVVYGCYCRWPQPLTTPGRMAAH
jgi:hypothetical protein